MRGLALFVSMVSLCVQAQVKPVVSQRQYGDQVNVVRLAPRYATAIRMPEPVSSVVVGDPVKFLAEHSEKEPTLVLVITRRFDSAASSTTGFTNTSVGSFSECSARNFTGSPTTTELTGSGIRIAVA